MRRLTYVLQFHRGSAIGTGQQQPAVAPGTVVTTRLESGGVTSQFAPLDGVDATLDLAFAVNGDSTRFLEWGSVSFADERTSSLTFSSIGAGTLGPADVDGFCHGIVTYAVQSGGGQFDGASGLIASNFLVDLTTDELIDTQLGVIRLP
jgi:hypothetical protein